MIIESFSFRPLVRAQAEDIVSWRYPEPYVLYNVPADRSAEIVEAMLQPHFHYYSVHDAKGELIAFRCFGPDAQVVGGDYSAEALDMGGGLRPDFTGRGLGGAVLGAAIDFAIQMFQPSRVRATVASFNHRALRVCQRAGYVIQSEFERRSDERMFIILLKKL